MMEPTPRQIDVAKLLGIDVSADSSAAAAARIHDALADVLMDEPARPSTERQRSYGKTLGLDLDSDSVRVSSAKIGAELKAKNQVALERLALKPGDRVLKVEEFEVEGKTFVDEREFVVSSIQADGRVYFKGGQGQGAWPIQLTKI